MNSKILINSYLENDILDIYDLEKLEELTYQGNSDARFYLSTAYALGEYGAVCNPDKLIEIAEFEGEINPLYNWAQHYVLEGICTGKYGFKKRPQEVLLLSEIKTWHDSFIWIAEGYANGCYGFPQDLPRSKLYYTKWKRKYDKKTTSF